MGKTILAGRGRLWRTIGVLFVLVALAAPAGRQPAVAAARGDVAASDELEELWSFDTEGSITEDPLVVDGVVYVRSNDGAVFAVDAATGEELWQAPTWARGFEPMVADGLLFTAEYDEESGAGRLIALDVASEGEDERWAADLQGAPVGRPAVTESGLVLVSTVLESENRSRLVALDLEDGAERWSFVGSRYGIESFLFADEMIWFRAGTQLVALDIDGRLRWILEMGDALGPLFFLDGVLYGSIAMEGTINARSLFAFDAAIGEPLWNDGRFNYGTDVALLAVDERTLYLGNVADADNDAIGAFDPDLYFEEDKAARWLVDGVPGLLSALVAVDGLVYAGTNKASDDDPGAVVVLDAETGETVARADVPAFAVTVAGGVIYTGWGDGVLHAFAAPVGGGDRAEAGATLDLAAMTLTPRDLAEVGLDSYGLGYGETVLPDGYIAGTAQYRDLPEDEVREILGDAGFRRTYTSYLYRPADADDPAGASDRFVLTYVLEFTDADGAAAAWDFLEDESDSETAADLDDVAGFGDESEATRDSGEAEESGNTYDRLDLSVRLGNLHVGVTVVDWTGEEPDLGEAEDLAERLLERTEAVLDGDGPGLGGQVARLAGDEIVPSADYYLIWDGEALPLYGEAAEDIEYRADAAADIDQTDGYRFTQQIVPGQEGLDDDAWYLVELLRFADEDAASDWLAGTEERIEGNADFDDLEVDEDAPTFGDESICYTLAITDGVVRYRGVALLVGDTVAVVEVIGPERAPADAVEELAEVQAACLEEGACLDPVALPDGLGTSGADESGSSATTSGESYVSPTWDYTVSWDPETWVATGDERDDGIEFHIMGSVLVTAVIQRTESSEGDPETCMTEAIERAQGGDSPLVESEDLPAPRTIDEAVAGLYELGDFAVLYVECRPLVDGEAVILVVFSAPVGEYEWALPALEELLAGIEVA